VPAPLDRLPVVALLRGDVAEPRPAALDIDVDQRELGAGAVGEPFLLQADPRAGGGGHATHAGGGGAVDHVDGPDLAFRLQEDAAGLGHPAGGGLGDLAGGRDRIAVVGAASREDRALYDGFVPLEQFHRHGALLYRPATVAALVL